MVIMVNRAVDACGHFQSFNVGLQAGREVVTEPCLLRFVEQESVVEVLECVLGNPHPDHGRPMVPFTDSQSRSCAEPLRTLARRRSRSAFCSCEISIRSKRSRKSSQMASMIWIFRSIGSALTSSTVMEQGYAGSGARASLFLL